MSAERLTPERLAEIRAKHGGCPPGDCYARDLLTEIDALGARLAVRADLLGAVGRADGRLALAKEMRQRAQTDAEKLKAERETADAVIASGEAWAALAEAFPSPQAETGFQRAAPAAPRLCGFGSKAGCYLDAGHDGCHEDGSPR